MKSKAIPQRGAALALAFLLTLPAVPAGAVGNGVETTYDEAYYALLDYYGNLTEGSVVKSYTMNGAASLTDYGAYDQVVNLTDGTVPESAGDRTVFRFDQAPDHFYFEGKTAQPFQDLPWSLSIAYRLNGVAVPAEELAGKTGVVEITVKAVPNPEASEYARNNYTLEAMAMFNQDDILSLEAPGAQVQLVGNIRAVLFAALPGEEQEFVIRVGAEDFSFDGLTFLMVPATLGQLSEIAKLGERKDELEEDYHIFSDSLDTLLDSLADLSGSLREAAQGLETLDEARDTISSGKDPVSEDADRLLEDLQRLNGSLNLLPGHLQSADGAVEDVSDALSDVAGAAVGLQGSLDDMEDVLSDLQRDLHDLRQSSGDVTGSLDDVGRDLDRLREKLEELSASLKALNIQINGGILDEIPENVRRHIKIQGQNLSGVLAQVGQLEALWTSLAVDSAGSPTSTITRQQFLTAAVIASGAAADGASALALLTQVQQLDGAIAQVQTLMPGASAEDALTYLTAQGQITAAQAALYGQAKPSLAAAEQIYAAVTGGADKPMTKADFYAAMLMLNDLNKLPADQRTAEALKAITANKAAYARTGAMLAGLHTDHDTAKLTGLMENTAVLLGHLGSNGLTTKLGGLLGSMNSALRDLGSAGNAGKDMLRQLDDILDEVDRLDDTVQNRVPGLRETLRDTRILVNDMVTGLDDTHVFLTSFRDLADQAEDQLDEGARQSLTALAATLRKTARAMDATGDVQEAKGKINTIIEDTWTEYTGKVNNILLMDANAPAVSLTSAENPAPLSVQVLIRTQEIKTEEPEEEKTAEAEAEQTTFWGRVAQMFRDFWSILTGWLH